MPMPIAPFFKVFKGRFFAKKPMKYKVFNPVGVIYL